MGPEDIATTMLHKSFLHRGVEDSFSRHLTGTTASHYVNHIQTVPTVRTERTVNVSTVVDCFVIWMIGEVEMEVSEQTILSPSFVSY